MVKSIKIISAVAAFSLAGCSQQEVHTGTPILSLDHNDSVITSSALSKDGQFNLVADGKQVCLWKNSQKNSPLNCLTGNAAQFIELLEISDNNQFYLTSNQVTVRLYALKSNQQLGEWGVQDQIINDMDISANGGKILLGFRSGKASIIDVQQNKLNTFEKHRLDINSVSLSDDGSIAFTGSSDKTALSWQTDSGGNIYAFKHGSRVNHVSISNDVQIGFTLDAIKDRTFWDLSTGKPLSELDTSLRFFEFNDSKFSSDNSLLLTGSPKQVIKLWRVADGALVAQWQSAVTKGRASVLSVAYQGQDKAVTLNSDGLFEQWALPAVK